MGDQNSSTTTKSSDAGVAVTVTGSTGTKISIEQGHNHGNNQAELIGLISQLLEKPISDPVADELNGLTEELKKPVEEGRLITLYGRVKEVAGVIRGAETIHKATEAAIAALLAIG